MKSRKLFNFIRTVAFAALVCTLAVTVIMMVYSATPGEKSAQQSDHVADSIKDTFKVEDEKVAGARLELGEIKGFVGEEYAPTVKFFPAETTDKEVTFTSADPSVVEVTAEGKLKLRSAGTSKVTATLTSDPSVKHSATITCLGAHPDKITSISLWQTDYKAGETQDFYLKDQDGNKLLLSMFKATDYDATAISFNDWQILPIKEGYASAKFAVKSGLGKKDYAPKTFENALIVNVTHNPNYCQPTDLVLVGDGAYDLKLGGELYLPDLIAEVLPAGASKEGMIYNYETKIVKPLTGSSLSAQKVGEVQIKISTKYNPALVKYVTVNIFNPPPTKLSIRGVANGRAQYEKTYTLRAFGDENYVDDVTWSIVKGTGKIDPETGKLSGLKPGKKVTVRATYADPTDPNAPELKADYTIKGVMYEDFASSMRKLIGHFLLFAVIGFGLAYTYVLWIKPRLLAVPLAVASGFGLAVASEALQLPAVTTGRYATWSDVLIDFLGSSIGIVVGFALLLIILLAFRLSKSRDEFKRAFDAVSAATVFCRTDGPKLQTLLSPDYIKPPRKHRSTRPSKDDAPDRTENSDEDRPDEA